MNVAKSRDGFWSINVENDIYTVKAGSLSFLTSNREEAFLKTAELIYAHYLVITAVFEKDKMDG